MNKTLWIFLDGYVGRVCACARVCECVLYSSLFLFLSLCLTMHAVHVLLYECVGVFIFLSPLGLCVYVFVSFAVVFIISHSFDVRVSHHLLSAPYLLLHSHRPMWNGIVHTSVVLVRCTPDVLLAHLFCVSVFLMFVRMPMFLGICSTQSESL